MQIIHDIETLRQAVAELKKHDARIAFVPTMGALHAGHMALVNQGRALADHVVTSIFVNPTQFGEGEDFNRYPRQEAEDAKMLETAGCSILWAPDVTTMYGENHTARIVVGGISEVLEGAARPGHFEGVATVVAKLLAQVAPDIALFGEKDYQQLVVIRRMVRDLGFPVEIVAVPTVRDRDGIALSSRNAYLSDAERAVARALPQALGKAVERIQNGDDIEIVLAEARETLRTAGFDPIDYVALRDAEMLEPLGICDRPARILAAARLGKTRLIDNMPVSPRGC